MLEALRANEVPAGTTGAEGAGSGTPLAEPRPERALDGDWQVARLRRGDEAAFETLYRRHVGAMHGLALRLSCRRPDAEELVQEAFLKAWRDRERFESEIHLLRWLRKVVVHGWINRIREKRPEALADHESGESGESGESTIPDPVSTAGGGLRLDLERALAQLTPRLRAVVVLFDVYGLRHEEIAETLEMTAGAAKVQLHRGRRRLRELLT